ncbi:MAG: archease [Gaiellaceae bacterium]
MELAGADHELLLADWLSELVFLAEVEQFTPVSLSELQLTRDRLRAVVVGRRAEARPLVKAVTMNDLTLAEKEGAWHGRVVLDV